jgi:DNA-binding beta-propeller fold protein YncE
MVALPGSNSVEVITFAEYAQVAATTAAGGQITSVAVSPDNQTLVGWYDSAISVMAGGKASPITGILKGPVSGIGITPYLAGTKLNSVAISPVSADDAIYVARQGAAEIDVYKLSTMASIATIPIPLGGFAARQPVAVAVSSDGKTLFALVADGSNQFSFVVIAADVGSKTFTVAGDVVAYTARWGQVATPFAIGATADGTAAYTVDTSTATLWTLTGSGTSWSVSPSGVALASGVASAIPSAIAVTPDGTAAYVSMQAGSSVYIAVADLDAQTSRLVLLPDPSTVMNLTSLAVSADGGSLYASDVASAAIRVLDARSLRIDQTLGWQSNVLAPWSIAAASDGTGLFSANLNSKNIAIAQQVNPT